MPTLYILRDGTLDREVELGSRDLLIGRAPDNDIVLEEVDRTVSRHHAVLRVEEGRYVVVDTGSQNGVLIDGQRVERAELKAGKSVAIGSFSVQLDRPATPGALIVPAAAATVVQKVSALPSPPQAPAEAPAGDEPSKEEKKHKKKDKHKDDEKGSEKEHEPAKAPAPVAAAIVAPAGEPADAARVPPAPATFDDDRSMFDRRRLTPKEAASIYQLVDPKLIRVSVPKKRRGSAPMVAAIVAVLLGAVIAAYFLWYRPKFLAAPVASAPAASTTSTPAGSR